MLSRNGRQLASNCANGTSAVEKRFFDVLFRWSRVGCVAPRSRRNSTKTPVPEEAPQPKETLPDKVRHVMRLMPHSIVVLTTMASSNPGVVDWTQPGDSDNKGDIDPSLYRGITLSSFTSLSMGPEPLITFNIGFPSRTLSALTETRHFLIHVLKSTRRGAGLADTFTKGNATHTVPGTDARGKVLINTAFHEATRRPQLKLRVHEIDRSGQTSVRLPLLDYRPGVKAALECQVLGEGDRAGGGLIRIGDHVLVVAKVTGIIAGVGEFTSTASVAALDAESSRGLCYRDGMYAAAKPLGKDSKSRKQRGGDQDPDDVIDESDDDREGTDASQNKAG
ncbi:flavin reductase like domain-containing protein [Rhexocercosporidium sp. MPI-PUGE-AT-0058]|nr:flavin reductase like domain-containing protein [Rhexocercosporidium sp. MPI-PUGE-AT-0058]